MNLDVGSTVKLSNGKEYKVYAKETIGEILYLLICFEDDENPEFRILKEIIDDNGHHLIDLKDEEEYIKIMRILSKSVLNL
jgi:hypothetical protein